MITATLQLSPERAGNVLHTGPLVKIGRLFRSKITVQRGDGFPMEITADRKSRDAAEIKSPRVTIVVDGTDELNAAAAIIDYFNHGAGI